MTAAELDAIRRQVRDDDEWNGLMLDELTYRVTALEAILAARWPRSVLVRHRVVKDLRASVAVIGGDGFTVKRLNALGTGWMQREQDGES